MKLIQNFIREFQEFAIRGNVIDLAVGVVVGTGFGKITGSLVNDIIMPIVGLLIGGIDFTHFSVTLKEPIGNLPPVTIRYGIFINTMIDFTIAAFAMFVVIKIMNNWKRKEEAKPEEVAILSREEQLLTEIRDVLRAKNPA